MKVVIPTEVRAANVAKGPALLSRAHQHCFHSKTVILSEAKDLRGIKDVILSEANDLRGMKAVTLSEAKDLRFACAPSTLRREPR